jgi:hypothetical protein
MIKKLLSPLFVFVLLMGCQKDNPAVMIPSYLEIDTYKMVVDTGASGPGSPGQGTGNQNFTDVLLYVNNQAYGYYPIPGKIPVTVTGRNVFLIRPVIRVGGVSVLRVDYPVMKGCDTSITVQQGQTTKVVPVFKYFSSDVFSWSEGFETHGSYSLIPSSPTYTNCLAVISPGFESGGCLDMHFDPNHPYCQTQSVSAFVLPTDGSNVYLEFNYKCDIPFQVGVIGTNSYPLDHRLEETISPSSTWNKMYINLSEIVSNAPVNPSYYIFFNPQYNGVGSPHVYLDNIRLIHQ